MNKKIVIILFVCLLVFTLWFYLGQQNTEYTIGFLLDNNHIEFIFEDWNKYIWPQEYEISCTSSSYLDGYDCRNLLGWDNSQGWKGSIENCTNEWIEFTFIDETYIESITIQKYPFFELLENTAQPKDISIESTRYINGKPIISTYEYTLGKNEIYEILIIDKYLENLKINILNNYQSSASHCSLYLVDFWTFS